MNFREEEDPFEEDIVFDQAGLLNTTRKSAKSAIRRVSSGKCATFSKTLGLCGAFLGLGLTCAIPGPATPVPPTELLEDTSLMSPELMFRCAGFMIGSMFGGMLLDRFNRLFLVFLALLVTSVLVTIIPWCSVVWLLRTDVLLLGATIGFLSTGGNVLCLDLWGRNSGPFMQALHFSFSLGVFLAPLLAQPLTGPVAVPSVLPSTTFPPTTLHRLSRSAPVIGFSEGGAMNSSNFTVQTPVALLAPSQIPPVVSSLPTILESKNILQSTSSPSPNLSSTASSTPQSTNLTYVLSLNSSLTQQNSSVVSSVMKSTVMPEKTSSSTHRAPKPKPELINAEKLDNTRNWEKVPVGKPRPEDLVPVPPTTKSTTPVKNLTSSGNSTTAVPPTTRSLSSPVPSSQSTPLIVSSTNVTSQNISSPLPRSTPSSTTAIPPVSTPASSTHRPLPHIVSVSSHTKPGTEGYTRSTTVGQKHFILKSQQQHSPAEEKPLSTKKPFVEPQPSKEQIEGQGRQEDQDQEVIVRPVKEQPEQPRSQDTQQKQPTDLYGHPGEHETVSQQQRQQIFTHQDEHVYSHQQPNHHMYGWIGEHVQQQQQQQQQAQQPQQQQPQQQQQHQQHTLQSEQKERTGLDYLGHRILEGPSEGSGKKSAIIESKNSSQSKSSSSIEASSFSPKHVHHSKPVSIDNDTEEFHPVIDVFANHLEKYGLSKMQLSYLVVGMVLLATSLLFLGFLCFNPRDPKSKTDEEETNGHVARGGPRGRNTSGRPLPRWLRNTLISLMYFFLMVISGVQAMYGQLLLAFALHSPLALSQSTGSALTATFWGALTSTRFACILLASALSPTAMLILSVALCSCATWLLSALATSSEAALWVGSVMVGVGTASVFPSALLWMQRHVLITHRTAAMLVMGPAMGDMLFPSFTYKMMASAGPGSLLHVPALLSLCAIALWATTWRLARHPRRSLCARGDGPSGYQLANQNDEDDLLDLSMSPVINGNNITARNTARSYANGHGFHRSGS